MIKVLLIIAALVFVARFIYFNFILPAHLAQFTWYARYEQLLDMVKNISSYRDYVEADKYVQEFCSDTRYLKDGPDLRQCVRRLYRKMQQQRRRYSPKLKVA